MQRFFALSSFVLAFYTGMAQQVSGTVAEAESGVGLQGVAIINKTAQRGVSSQERGRFSIGAKKGDTLYFQSLGYAGHTLILSEKNLSSPLKIYLQKSVENLSETVITGTQTEYLLKNTPVYTQIISAKDIQQSGIKSFTNLLETSIAGLNFTHHAGVANITLQGLESNYILILINGKKIAGETHNNIDFENIDVDDIQQIEIVKGASSALYGSNAMGGVINIITHKNTEPFRAQLSSTLSSLGQSRERLGIAFQHKNLSSSTSAIYNNKQNYWLNDSEPITYHYPTHTQQESTLGKWEVEGGHSLSVNQDLNYQIAKDWKAGATGNFYHRKRHNSAVNKGEVLDTHFYNYATSASVQGNLSGNTSLSAEYSYANYQKAEFYKRISQTETVYRNPIHEAKLSLQHPFSETFSVLGGFSFLSESLKTYMFNEGDTQSAHLLSAYVQAQYLPKQWLTLVAGARYDYHSAFGKNWSPKLSAMAKIHENWRLRASVAQGFRTPSLKELYTDWDHLGMFRIVGNPSLHPERNTHLIASVSHHSPKVEASASVFYNDISHKISTIANKVGDTLKYENLSRQTLRGAEINLKYRPTAQLSLSAGLAFTNDGMHENGKKLTGTRPWDASLIALYKWRKTYVTHLFSLRARTFSAMQVYDFDPSLQQYYYKDYPAYALLHLNYTLKWKNWGEASFLIENLLNYQPSFYDFYTPNTPGISGQISLTLHLEAIFKSFLKEKN